MKAIAVYPGKPNSMHLENIRWLSEMLTTRVDGLENYEEMVRHLTQNKEAIKVYIEVAQNS